MLGNKAKLDLQRTLPSQLPATTVVPPTREPTGFWENAMHDNNQDDVPPNMVEENDEDGDEDMSNDEEDDDIGYKENRNSPRRQQRRSRMPSRRDRSGGSVSTTVAPDGHNEARSKMPKTK